MSVSFSFMNIGFFVLQFLMNYMFSVMDFYLDWAWYIFPWASNLTSLSSSFIFVNRVDHAPVRKRLKY